MRERRLRGYSRAFTPRTTGKRYLLDDIPATLWAAVRAKAARDGVSLRACILGLLTGWINGDVFLPPPDTPPGPRDDD
jgi:hypothetical protein